MATPQYYVRKLCQLLEWIVDLVPGSSQVKTIKTAIVLIKDISSASDLTFLLQELLIALTELAVSYAGFWWLEMLINAAIKIIKILL